MSADTTTTPEKKKLKKIIKDGLSNLSFLKIAGTTLAAISMALISTRLTSVVSSLILVGIVSVGSAVLSEVFKIILTASSMGAKKVVTPILKIQPINEETGEVHIVREEVDSEPDDDAENENLDRDGDTTDDSGSGSPVVVRFLKRLWSSSFIKFVILFASVALLTIMTSYVVSNANHSTQTAYTTVTHPVQGLTQQEKNQIASDASAQAGATASSSASTENEKLTELEKENTSLSSELEAQKKRNDSQDTTIQQLQESVKALQQTDPQTTVQPTRSAVPTMPSEGSGTSTSRRTTQPGPSAVTAPSPTAQAPSPEPSSNATATTRQ